MLQPWWERFPRVLQEEEADLERLGGRPPRLNDELLRASSVRQYEVPYSVGDVTYDLTITYSDFHPYFRVEVTTTHAFRTHQQPFRGNLCLIQGGTWNWNVDETAAELIEAQMPGLLADNESDGPTATVAPTTTDHVEPFAGYFTYEARTAVRVDGAWLDINETDTGSLVLGLDQPADARALRATVLEVLDDDGNVLRRADPEILSGYTVRVSGRWLRLADRPRADDARSVLEEVIERAPHFGVPARQRIGQHDVEIVGVVFTDGARPGLDADAWMFVVHGTGPRPQVRADTRRKGQRGGRVSPPREQVGPYLAHAFRSGRSDMAERVAALAPLAGKKVVLFGAGGIGAPSAVELAKAGLGTLVVVEFDVIDPGNAPRWILGYQAAGLHKLDGIGQLLRWNWPYTKLELRHFRLGTPRTEGGGPPEWAFISETVKSADLIFDATAEVGVNYFLSELAKELEIPYITASATEGGWGGRVARFRPGNDQACWVCLMHRETEVSGMIPPADPDPSTHSVWPAGCTDPTFTGTGFDVGTVSHAGVRLAASTLCEGHAGAYPLADWDVAVYAFRDAVRALPGTVETFDLSQHPDCEPCRIRRSG